MQIEITGESVKRLWQLAKGRKTHSLVVLGMIAIALNHFHLLPGWIDLGDYGKPENWLHDEWELALGSTLRSALANRGKA